MNNKSVSKFVSLLVLSAFLLAACGGGKNGGSGGGGGAAQVAGACANDFFPVVEGATWTYSGTGPTGDFTWTMSVSDASNENFTLSNQLNNAEVTTTQKWSCTPDGLAALEFGGGPEASLATQGGFSATYETTDSSGVTIPAHIATGDTWTQTFTVHVDMQIGGQAATAEGTVTQTFTAMGTESVTVAAGSFNAIKVQGTQHFDLQMNMGGALVPFSFDNQTTNWLASGVGWVKMESAASGEDETLSATMELQSYSIP